MVVLICYIAAFYIKNLGTNDISRKVWAIYDEKNVFFWIGLKPTVSENNAGEFPLGMAASSFQVHFQEASYFFVISFQRE